MKKIFSYIFRDGGRGSASFGLLILRISSGAMMLFAHGLPKLTGFSDRAPVFSDPVGVGSSVSLVLVIFAEFFCSILIILGLFTRAAVIPLLIMLLVIVFIVHVDDPWQKQEFALIYFSAFFTIFFSGAGKFSLDRIIFKR